MDKKQLCDILFKWLQTFELEKPFKSLHHITDGVVMAQALHQIAPVWFSESWLSKIKTDTGPNWRLKVSNLKKILEKMLDYYLECLNQNLGGFVKPDPVKIADQQDPNEIARMLQLILGCAVNCENKEVYIQKILDMDENDQRVMMECIQELDTEGGLSIPASLHPEPQVEYLTGQLNEANAARDLLQQRVMELGIQINLLQEEKATAIDEKNKLMEMMKTSVGPDSGSGLLRRQMDALKEELFKVETSRDDIRIKLEVQTKELTEAQTRIEELNRTAAEARQLKDEVDILRETADKVDKYEIALQSYKKKLEETGDLKRELKLLEAKNSNYIQQNMELEEELKKSNVWKAQVEAYKKQTTELHERLNEETKRADRMEFELKTAQEKLAAAQREKERLLVERDSLKEANEELKCLQLQGSGQDGPGPAEGALESVTEGLVSTTELRQKLVRLQYENNMLRLNQKNAEDNSDSLSVVQALLDDAREQVEKMRQENREAHQRIIQLEAEARERAEGSPGAQNLSESVKRALDLQQTLQRERQRHTVSLEEKDLIINDNKNMITLLQEKLSQKELELQELEDKHKKYLEKARSVMRAIDPSINPNQEVSMLRSQLLESQKSVKELQKELETTRRLTEAEEKCMATAYHNLAAVRQREEAERRLHSLGHGHTFLARQRQPSARKLNVYNSK